MQYSPGYTTDCEECYTLGENNTHAIHKNDTKWKDEQKLIFFLYKNRNFIESLL